MAQSMKDIKQRIKSVENTKQITKAMELVATSKLRKAKQRVEKSRPFFITLYSTMVDISAKNQKLNSIFAAQRTVKNSCFIVIGGDRGLAGGYNAGIIRHAEKLMQGKNVKLVPIGKKIVEYFGKRPVEIIQQKHTIVENISLAGAFELATNITGMYRRKEIDEVVLVYTNFVSTLSQQPAEMNVLPLSFLRDDVKKADDLMQIVYEPSPEEVFDRIVPQYIGGLIYGAVCESFASEQGARRTAMESATDNANEMVEDLSLIYNRARQGAITQEITEISAGAQALE